MDYDDSNMELDSEISSSTSSLTDLEEEEEDDDEEEEEVASSHTPLHNMSSLLHQLPFKKGLSKYYQGKSQSFISMTKVSCLEDLIKHENPYNKKLKSSRSYGGFLSDAHMLVKPSSSSSENEPSRGSCSSSLTNSKRNPTTQKSITSSASTNNLSSSTGARTTFLI